MADFRKEGRPCPIAHRGCMEAGPENSLTAFEEAAALGAGGRCQAAYHGLAGAV